MISPFLLAGAITCGTGLASLPARAGAAEFDGPPRLLNCACDDCKQAKADVKHMTDARDDIVKTTQVQAAALKDRDKEIQRLKGELSKLRAADPDLIPVRWRTRRAAADGLTYEGPDPAVLRAMLPPMAPEPAR